MICLGGISKFYPSGVEYDPLAAAWFTGLTLTDADKLKYNNLFLALRAAGIHDKIDRLHIYAGATEAAALKSLFGNYTAIPLNSPTWTRAVGYIHTGTSAINPNFSGAVNFTKNDHCWFLGIADKSTAVAGGFGGGGLTGAQAMYLVQNAIGQLAANSFNMQANNIFTRTSANIDYAIRRSVSTSYTVHQDGVASASINTSTGAAAATVALYDGGYNNNGVLSDTVQVNTKSRYSGQGSSAVDPAVIRTIINNFISSL